MRQRKLTSYSDVWSLLLMMATWVTDKLAKKLFPDRMAFLRTRLTTG